MFQDRDNHLAMQWKGNVWISMKISNEGMELEEKKSQGKWRRRSKVLIGLRSRDAMHSWQEGRGLARKVWGPESFRPGAHGTMITVGSDKGILPMVASLLPVATLYPGNSERPVRTQKQGEGSEISQIDLHESGSSLVTGWKLCHLNGLCSCQ